MSQSKQILEHLETRGSITPLEALERYGCFRLASRINDLRMEHDIKTTIEKHQGKCYARYSLGVKEDLFV